MMKDWINNLDHSGLRDGREYYMRKSKGLFSQSLESLEIQLKTLFYGSGNEDAVRLLDRLSELGISEQQIVLKSFNKVIDRILKGTQRCLTEEDLANKALEDELYKEILEDMNAASKFPPLDGKRLEVLEGGRKAQGNKVLIDLDSARKNKRSGPKPIIN